MHINYKYVLDKCNQVAGKILDYGCGEGDVATAGREQGIDIVGVEAFYDGNEAEKAIVAKGLLDVTVFALSPDFRIPFSGNEFDLAVSNQVLEHVQDLDLTLSEIYRVMTPSGKFLALFPSVSVIREGHCGIPFAHWFSQKSVLRYPFMRFMRFVGFGFLKNGKPQSQWVRDFMDYLDNYVIYRSFSSIQKAFHDAGFNLHFLESDHVNYRLRQKGVKIPRSLGSSPPLRFLSQVFFRRFGGLVLLAEKA